MYMLCATVCIKKKYKLILENWTLGTVCHSGSETCPKGYKVNQTSLSPLVPEDAMPLTSGGRRNES